MTREDLFMELLSHVAREVTRRQASEVCCGDLTLEQFQTMRSVDRAERATIGSLSAEQKVDLSTMSRNVSLLERNGYLVRRRGERDARVVHVGLTPKGKKALSILSCSERDTLRDVFERVPAGDRLEVLQSLETLRSCLAPCGDPSEEACCPAPVTRRFAL